MLAISSIVFFAYVGSEFKFKSTNINNGQTSNLVSKRSIASSRNSNENISNSDDDENETVHDEVDGDQFSFSGEYDEEPVKKGDERKLRKMNKIV